MLDLGLCWTLVQVKIWSSVYFNINVCYHKVLRSCSTAFPESEHCCQRGNQVLHNVWTTEGHPNWPRLQLPQSGLLRFWKSWEFLIGCLAPINQSRKGHYNDSIRLKSMLRTYCASTEKDWMEGLPFLRFLEKMLDFDIISKACGLKGVKDRDLQ